MVFSPLFLLAGAAAAVALLHATLPDHWVPLAIVARAQRWSIMRVVRVTILAAAGHLLASLVLAGILALIGLQFQHELDMQQGHMIGGILVLTGMVFLIWGLLSLRTWTPS
jgi:nickel/cobalt transporter (NicO) family protein